MGIVWIFSGCASGGSSAYFQFPQAPEYQGSPKRLWSESFPRRASRLTGTPEGGIRVTLVAGPGPGSTRAQMEWNADGDPLEAPTNGVAGGPLPGEERRVRQQISGEIHRVYYSGKLETGRRAAVLFSANRSDSGGKLTISVLELKNGGRKSEAVLDRYARDIALSENGEVAYSFGNGPLGQWLVAHRVESVGRRLVLKQEWERGGDFHANFPSRLNAAGNVVVIGFEKPPKHYAAEPVLYGFNPKGEVLWSLPIQTHTGGYLVETAPRGEGEWSLFVASDDGNLRAYRLKKSE